ncbi:uncharacterized protein LOC136081364 [Hydra vulgaris]|uniref:Uncharacterized protein LOC136081364 n=1 Tax=Hydra vulgaris TaxID=6087 RepID=A0ABM4BZQ7_HYDVU
MFRGLMNFLEDHDIDIQNCCGQSYDNASAMSGRDNGLQAKVSAVNHHATWIPCAGHSLNLVGVAASECYASAVAFLDFLEVSTTQWSCRSDAVKALIVGYHPIRNTLQNISENENETPKARSEANDLHGRMCKLETGIYAAFWHDILARNYGGSGEARLTTSEKFRVQNFLPVIDQYQTSLNQCLKAYENNYSLFGFLRKQDSLECNEIEAAARKLVDEYKDDLDPALSGELVQFTVFFTKFLLEEDDNIGREHFLYKLLLKKQVVDTFPNVEIMLRMYLVLMITNCSGERSFSKMKFIKNRLRTTMTHDRLSFLTLMSTEYDILREIDFIQLIQDFAKMKSRKVLGL